MSRLLKQRERKEREDSYVYPRCCTHSMKRVYEYKSIADNGKKSYKATGWRCPLCNKYLDDTHPEIKEKMELLKKKRQKIHSE